MTPPTAAAAARGTDDLRHALRQGTQAAHERLEAALGLLAPEPRRDRFVHVLARFHAFHRIWEPGLARWFDEAFTAPRRRLALLRGDLERLGVDTARLDAAPPCHAAAALLGDAAGAWGSLYVMEGSTLGGRVIARHLRGAAWCPPGGLRYFDPHGADAGLRWRETLALLETAPAADAPAVVDAARRSFELLHDWLTSGWDTTAAPAPAH